MPRQIPDDALILDLIPDDQDEIWKVATFALTFDGYRYWGNDECGDIANAVSEYYNEQGQLPGQMALSDVRACLFFEQRRWHHMDQGGAFEVGGKLYHPDTSGIERYMRYLLQLVRKKVEARDQQRKLDSLEDLFRLGLVPAEEFVKIYNSMIQKKTAE